MTQTRRAHDPQTSTEPRSLEATDRRTSGTNTSPGGQKRTGPLAARGERA